MKQPKMANGMDLNYYLSEMMVDDFFHRNPTATADTMPTNLDLRKTMFEGVKADKFHIFKKKPFLSIKDL